MTLQVSEKSHIERSHTQRRTKKSPETFPLARAYHAQTKLSWARAARGTKIAKMAAEEAELEELRQAIVAKSVLIKMLKAERTAAQKKVDVNRTALRQSVVELEYDGEYTVQQNDSLFMDGLSSDFERLVSTSPMKAPRGSSFTPAGDNTDGNQTDC